MNSLGKIVLSRNRGESRLRDISLVMRKVGIRGLEKITCMDMSYNSLDVVLTEAKSLASLPNLKYLALKVKITSNIYVTFGHI